MAKPVVYLAFANDNDAHLSLLKDERRQLKVTLSDLHDKQAIEVYTDESTNVQDLVNSFNRFIGRINIFHYGGHAGGNTLRLEEGEANAAGLAELFSQEDSLKLVFLNGCSTLPQVDRLMELGVKAVIATSVPINDAKAKDFSGFFYQALGTNRSVKSAFDFAVASLKSKYDDTISAAVVEYRGDLKLDANSSGEFPWNLYVNASHKDVLDWQLPYEDAPTVVTESQEPNYYLSGILVDMAEYDLSLQKFIDEVEKGDRDEREVLDEIVGALPWTIGAQLQKLISNSDSIGNHGLDRLKQIINTYEISAQLLMYILVSQIWEEKHKNGGSSAIELMNDLLSINENGVSAYNYVEAIFKLGDLFSKNKWTPFVEEFNSIFKAKEEDNQFFKAYLWLEGIRERLAKDGIPPAQAAQLSSPAEENLTNFIGSIGFLVNYEMVAVRNISVTSSRYEALSYHHQMGSLSAKADDYLQLKLDPRPFSKPAESDSVILTAPGNEDKMGRFLSLSPFIIDKNAFLDKTSRSLNIYIFSHVGNGEYFFKDVTYQFQKMKEHDTYLINTGYTEPKKEKKGLKVITTNIRPYMVLKQQFDKLRADLVENKA